MKKLFLIPLLTLMCSVMAWADPVTTLEELQAALNAGGEVTLGATIDAGTTGVTFTSGTATLNLGDFTITSSKAESYPLAGHNVTGGGTLKVSGGSLTITAGTTGAIEGTDGANAIYVNGGSLIIEDGTFRGENEGIFVTNGSLTINGGTLYGGDNAVWAGGSNASLTINGGDFSGSWGAVQSDNGASTVINDGTFKGTDVDLALGAYAYADASCTISGGEFNGKGIIVYTAGGTLFVNGGAFKVNPIAFVDFTSYIVTKPSSLYIVSAPTADVVAYNPNKLATYASLSEAVEVATAGDVIYVYKDDNTAVSLSKFITINANGHSINLSAGEGYALSNNDGVYTINGVAVIGTTHYTSLADAVKAASTGAVITLWADASAATVSKTLIINANGFDASAATAGNGYSRAATNDGYVFGKASKSGNIYTVTNYEELFFAINAATAGEEVQFANDIAYPATVVNGSTLNITKSITLNGQGYALTGYGKRTNGGACALVVNDGEASTIDVVIKNITVEKGTNCPINVRSKVHSLTIENAVIDITNAIQNESYNQGLTIGGTAANADPEYTLTITNTTINNGSKHYPIILWVPVKELVISNSSIMGWSSLYFKPGTNGTKVTATNTTFDARNKYTGKSNTFGAFVLEDGGINIELNNCVVDATYTDPTGVAKQSMFLLSAWKELYNNTSVDPCSMTIKGANSHIKGAFIDYGWTLNVPVTFDIQGGSYYQNDFETALATEWVNMDDTKYVAEKMSQGGENIYRVHEKAAEKEPGVMYDLNDDVPSDPVEGAGDNPNSSFDLSTGTEMTLNQETTTAGYVQISDNATAGATTVTVAKNDADIEHSQTLVINNGLDVQGESQVIVEPTAALVIGEGGIVTSKPENIVIEADKEGAASLLLHPAITVNQTPELTVKMTAKQIGKFGSDYSWHRFAMPVDAVTSLPRDKEEAATKIFTWDYDKEEWAALTSLSQLEPFRGYTLTTTIDKTDVVYTFKGHLVGNLNTALNFTSEGYNFFGNSYTGYIDIVALADQLLAHADIDAAVWVWNTDKQNYQVVTLGALRKAKESGLVDVLFEKWQQEIAPMQTFILRIATPGVSSASTVVDYNNAIWKNPRYGNDTNSGAGAPARKSTFEGNVLRMSVAANGMKDNVLFMEETQFSDAFDKGYDGTKFMNTEDINIYSTVNNENYSAVATDQIEGKMLTIETVNDVNYTISFDVVLGETEYALRDNATNKVIAIEEGASYEFAAQPNSTVEGRFEIVDRANVVTSIDNAQDNKANVKGIYTIMGQYVGENFDVLPTGVYVVDGVKIVK